MSLFSSISDAYKRLRHTKGFGVHSPLGYGFVKQVLSPGKESYYGYEDIRRRFLESHGGFSGKVRSDAEFILRLAVFVKAGSAYLSPGMPDLFRTALKASDSRIRIYTSAGDMTKADLIITDRNIDSSSGRKQNSGLENKTIFFYNAKTDAALSLSGKIDNYIWFRGRRNSIFLVRDNMMDSVTYSVRL